MNITDLLSNNALGRGVVIHYAPMILKGAMKEYLGKVPFKEMVAQVKENKSLWAQLPPQYQTSFKNVGSKLGDLEWLTPEWVIEAARTSAPSLASLFIGWPEGQEWLLRQTEEIKLNIKGA